MPILHIKKVYHVFNIYFVSAAVLFDMPILHIKKVYHVINIYFVSATVLFGP